jgi:hypothetical protein
MCSPCTVTCSPMHCRVFAPALPCVRPCSITCSPMHCHVFAHALPYVRPCSITCSPMHCHVFAHALSCVRPRTAMCSPVHCHVFAKGKGRFCGAYTALQPDGWLYSRPWMVPSFISRGCPHQAAREASTSERRKLNTRILPGHRNLLQALGSLH